MAANRDVALSKGMQTHPTRAYYLTRGNVGEGAELRDLRSSLDAVMFDTERGKLPKILSTDLTSLDVSDGAAGKKLFVPGLIDGYEKAHAHWTYATGKVLTVTAIKPGELGNRIRIIFASDADDAVVAVGNVITITVDNDDATTPSQLQTIVAADRKLRQLIVISSTDDTAIPHAWTDVDRSAYLAGGTGLGWGGYLSGSWEANTSMLFTATKPGRGPALYQLEWHNTGAAKVPTITADRKKCSILYQNGVTTAADIVAAVNADLIAKEHVFARSTTTGAGFCAVTNHTTMELGEDQGTVVFVEGFQADVVEVAATYVKFTIPAASGVTPTALAKVRLVSGLIDYGSIQVLTQA